MPSGVQLLTLDLTESNLPCPLPACLASLTSLEIWLDFRNESRPFGASDFDDIALGCPMLQQLTIETDRGHGVDSWEPLTRLPYLRELTIEAHPDGRAGGPFPAVDLDAFPAIWLHACRAFLPSTVLVSRGTCMELMLSMLSMLNQFL